MRLSKYIITSVIIVLFGILPGCTDLNEVWYDEVVPETFFNNPTNVKSALYRPFTHARWYVQNDRWRLQEFAADQFSVTTKGSHFYNGGENERYHYHQWTPEEGWIWGTWRGTMMGIALALDAQQDLEKQDYESLGLIQADKDDHINQLNVLIAYFYLRGLDYFGGLPIFTSLDEENVPRSTDLETFNHIEKLLTEAIPKLPKKQAGEPEEGAIKQAAAATMLAQLYFNAEAYTGEPMYEEAAAISQDIIDGVYGDYELDSDWFGPFDFENNQSPEVIWLIPSEFNKLEYNWFFTWFYHYNSRVYFNTDDGAYNGYHLTPSRKPDSTLYTHNLGSPYEKFHDSDLRKKPYTYLGSGRYEGMFLVGEQISPITGDPVIGSEEYEGELIVFEDRVGRFSEVGPDKAYSSVSELPSRMSEGEENTGIRLVKTPIAPMDESNLRWGAGQPVIRLAEVYYMLAECKWRDGDKAGAAKLINQVRARNFPDGIDPNSATATNLDKYRMVDEWGREFLGEGRRRTDLIRWNMLTTEAWWDHEPSNSEHLRRFPIPREAISGNNSLDQNSGY